MQQSQMISASIRRRRPSSASGRWQPIMSCRALIQASSLALLAALLLATSGSDAIVKQTRSDDVQQKSAPSSQSAAYNNHQASSSASSQSSQSAAIASSSSSAAAAAQSAAQNGASSVSQQSAAGSASGMMGGGAQQYSNYMQQGGQSNNKLAGYSSDNLAASANSPEQSYQAAANSVNMALANSGIFSPSMSAGVGNSQQMSASPSSSAGSSNPQHYYYYPSKESSSAAAKAANDMLSNAASNNYQSMAYPNYGDQLGSALSSMSASGPEAAASSQDASYLPQPGMQGNADFANSNNNNNNGPQQQQPQQGQQNNMGPQNNGGFNDMGAFSSSMNSAPMGNNQAPQQQGSSISFNGPTNNGMMGASGPQASGQGNINDYLSQSQMASPSVSQPQQVPPMGAYSNLYSQLGDLSTSNFGNNAGGIASVASYMAPGGQQHGNQQQSAQDLFANLANSANQFNSAASQLSPSAVSPPNNQQPSQQQQQQPQQPQNSLFGSTSSLFNPAATQQQQQQQQQQQSNNLFSNQQYLNSFLSPHQFGQLAAGAQQPLTGAGLYDNPMAASVPAATSVAPAPSASTSSKRFGISSFIMPMLALAGLSLLIPTMSNIGTAVGRKKRSIQESEFERKQTIAYEPLVNGVSGQLAKENSIGEYMDRIERYYSIYKNAVESDDCMNRLICEFGDAVKDVTGKGAIVTVIEKLVPTWMTGKVHLFKDAALSEKESSKEKCKKYVCHSNKRQH